jgi:iron complex transport system ATP-binding protein
MRAQAPVLAVERLGVTRGGVRILDEISWRVRAGEHWVILGANGSGKTSLLSAITGYLTPTDGAITLLGQQYGQSDWRELRRHIGLVSSSIRQLMADDEPALESVISGKYGVIDLWQKIPRPDRATARKILQDVECAYLAERPWAVLSQGERQRVLIGRALMARPRALILDEPCAGLDPAAREHFLQFLQRLGRRTGSPALILVTHHVEEIMPVFSHVLVLKAGRVLAAGRKSAVLTGTNLTSAFGSRLKLQRRSGRFGLHISTRQGVVI